MYGDKYHASTDVIGQPSKKSKKALLNETTYLGCVSHESPQRKSILREDGKFGSNHTVKFLKATVRREKNGKKKGPSQGIIQKCEPQEPKSIGSQIRGKNES